MLDAMLRDVAFSGSGVSAHPEVIPKMGVKSANSAATRRPGFGSGVDLAPLPRIMSSGSRQPPLSHACRPRVALSSPRSLAATTAGCVMADLQTLNLILFAAGTFAAALVTGVAGFAFGIVAAAVWLHFLSPAQTTGSCVGP
jgi:hypothetical protein